MAALLPFRAAPTRLLRMEINTSARWAVKAWAIMVPKSRKEIKSMNDLNRVLLRQGARALNDQEVAMVAGGLRTLTACTLAAAGTLDGDTFHSECGSPDQ